MFNVQGAAQVPLGIFGGLVTEIPAMNLPAGVSPDCEDMAFRPGAVFSRPGLVQVFTDDDAAIPTYGKSYVDNTGIIRNVYLDAAGNLSVENINTSPGTKTLIGTVTASSYAKSITAFGREYIAVSDGLHGTDIPLQYDGTNLDRVTQYGPGSPPTVANLAYSAVAMALSGGFSMVRATNTVTVKTAAAHNLQIGYQALITDMTAAAIGGGIATIVINNEDLPGIATITTNTAHGLTPGVNVSLSNVSFVNVPGNITHLLRQGQNVQITLDAAHGLSVGAYIAIVGTVDNTFLGNHLVTSVNGPQVFGFTQAEPTNVNAAVAAGNVLLLWPTTAAQVLEVIEAPTATSFQVQFYYSNGTWTSGNLSFEWDGTFFVATVPSSTLFTYKQNGPGATTSQIGKVTPSGQVAPGKHRLRVSFLTRQNYLTTPSPPVEFVANGGQYLQITNIPTGPTNIKARVLEFTGAEGAYFFYIPVPGQVNGEVVSTATQLNDNTTTTIILDFSDNTLFAGIATSRPGNDTVNQVVIDSALGFGLFGQRLVTYGQRNRIQRLLNMGFDGGALPSTPTIPTGWLAAGGGAGGSLATGRFGQAWHVTGAGSIYQSGYLDAYGFQILTPKQTYTLRGWVKTAGATATVTISSASTGFSSTASLTPGTAVGAWLEAVFSLPMPAAIPTDMIMSLSGTGGAIVDELSIIYTDAPFINNSLFGSYRENPEAFDGVSGVFPAQFDDTRKIMTVGIIRGSLGVLTQDPGGRLHVIQDNGVTEPAGWSSNEIAANCGAMSSFCLTQSQADDATAAGGEDWFAWMSYSGARIYGGNRAEKISQEIQPDWDQINTGAWLTVWALNDPTVRRIYFGVPKGFIGDSTTFASAPNKIYHMDYKNLDGADEISAALPVFRGSSGELEAREHARKWCPWNIPANGAAMIYRAVGGPLYTVFMGGNGQYPGVSTAGCGNIFALCDSQLTDDCLGQIFPYYVTYAFTSQRIEQQMQLGGQRHLLQYLQWNAAGTGNLRVTPYVNTLSNPWPIVATIPLTADPTRDEEWGGGQASGQRIFLKFESLPV